MYEKFTVLIAIYNIMPSFLNTVFKYSAVYFAGVYTTSFYDCKYLIENTKPYIEPVREECIKVYGVAVELYNKKVHQEPPRPETFFEKLRNYKNPFE